MGVQNCILKTDSKVIAGQIKMECMVRDATLEKYLAINRRMENYFIGFTAEYIERTKNTESNDLAMAGTRKTTLPPDVFF
jgi:hypothetical protein